MKKIIFSILIISFSLFGLNSVKADYNYDSFKKECLETHLTGTAYEMCLKTYCDGDLEACKQSSCDSCEPSDKDCRCKYCDGEKGCVGQDIDDSGSYPKIDCGTIKIPLIIPKLTSTLISIIQIAVPILIIIFGSIDLVKAVIAQKDDEIKKGQQTFIKRLIAGALVFFVIFIVKMAIGLVAPHDSNNSLWDCVDYFIDGVD